MSDFFIFSKYLRSEVSVHCTVHYTDECVGHFGHFFE